VWGGGEKPGVTWDLKEIKEPGSHSEGGKLNTGVNSRDAEEIKQKGKEIESLTKADRKGVYLLL